MPTPMRITAPTLTALVSTKIRTERLAMRSIEMPLLRNTQAPSAMPARPPTETNEFTASSESESIDVSPRPRRPNTSSNRTT